LNEFDRFIPPDNKHITSLKLSRRVIGAHLNLRKYLLVYSETPSRMILIQYSRPVSVCLLNIAWYVLLPLFHNLLAAVEVELSVDYLPDGRISFCDAPHRNSVSSVSTILWGIFLWIGFKQFKVFGTHKAPFST